MDRDAFARAVQEAYPRLWLVAVACCQDRGQAEDIVQDAVMAALARVSQFQAGTNFQAWMATFVRHVARNHQRKSRRRATVAVDPRSLERHSPDERTNNQAGLQTHRSLMSVADWDETFDDGLRQAMRHLSTKSRMCLLLRIIEEMSYAQIAEILKIPEGTAMSHVHRAKQTLRTTLEKTGYSESLRP